MSAIVAIVGRPNVGKSTLFNKIIRTAGQSAKSTAITESIPGVTRDRNYGEAEWEGQRFVVIDTGGFYAEGIPHEDKEIARQVREQAIFAVEEADLIIHLLDSKEGLNPSDAELANILRQSGKKILWVANKVDTPAKETSALEFYSIGAEEVIPLSAISGLGFDEFMDKVASLISRPGAEKAPEKTLLSREKEIPRIAVVGRPNVGKSTLINALLSKKRLVVSPIPGTTRDAVDSIASYYNKPYLIIDTAGIRKRGKIHSIERFSVVRAMRSIERADVVIIVLDASEGIVDQDQRVAGLVEEHGKGAIVLLNKWDLVENPDEAYKKMTTELRNKIWFMDYVPFITTSGLEKKRITKIYPLIDEIIQERKKRIPTAELNKFLAKILAAKPIPTYRGKALKFYYITQVDIEPPTFTIFVNYPGGVKPHHLRYIERALREEYTFKGTPVRIYAKPR